MIRHLPTVEPHRINNLKLLKRQYELKKTESQIVIDKCNEALEFIDEEIAKITQA